MPLKKQNDRNINIQQIISQEKVTAQNETETEYTGQLWLQHIKWAFYTSNLNALTLTTGFNINAHIINQIPTTEKAAQVSERSLV